MKKQHGTGKQTEELKDAPQVDVNPKVVEVISDIHDLGAMAIDSLTPDLPKVGRRKKEETADLEIAEMPREEFLEIAEHARKVQRSGEKVNTNQYKSKMSESQLAALRRTLKQLELPEEELGKE